MPRSAILLLSIALIAGCRSTEKYNRQFSEPLKQAELKSDIDYVYRKLTKFHPQLYNYISKKELEYKFDSLKNSITSPLTPNDLYFGLSPVVASIKQGHTQLYIPFKRGKKESEESKKLGYTRWFPFKTEMIGNKLYILKDSRKTAPIKPGTEIISINGVRPQEMFQKYRPTISADGYNQTVFQKRLSWMMTYFFYMVDQNEEVSYQLKLRDSLWTIKLRRTASKEKQPEVLKSSTNKSKEAQEKSKKEQEKQGMWRNKPNTKTLKFLIRDSSIAVLKIADFKKGAYKEFYRGAFTRLTAGKTKALIIDLRNNGGGRLADAKELYSYLVDTSFRFSGEFEFTSRTSVLRNAQFLAARPRVLPRPLFTSIAAAFSIPPTLFLNAKLHRAGPHRYLYPNSFSKQSANKVNNFKGKVYVLINGGSFSASSLLAANLKGSGRAVFAGEETGGAQNGCVAGFLPVLTLPHSHLKLRFGLAGIEPEYLSKTEGRGIMPDIEVSPTIEDRIKNVDPELSQVVSTIKDK